MGKIRKSWHSVPLWLAFFLIVTIFLLLAAFASRLTIDASTQKSNEIQNRYITGKISKNDNSVTIRWNVDFHYDDYSPKDMQQYKIFKFIQQYASLFWYFVCVLSAGLIFYFTKLKKPLTLLNNASAKIAKSELDFSLEYTGNDEMARLCSTFETMREALGQNNQKMLHMLDERKQLNDAYTHDLRTPIAVLKGYTDILVKYIPTGKLPTEEILETAKTMSTHILRLEQFVDSMNTIQKLDDLIIQKEYIPTKEFLSHLKESADILCKGSGLSCNFESALSNEHLLIDSSAVLQVYENLLSNAIRFAKSKISIRCTCDGVTFFIAVLDDGNGFSDKELIKATNPYYSGKNEKSEFHFGLGLHICRTLCEKHGGALSLENITNGSAKITACFSIIQ